MTTLKFPHLAATAALILATSCGENASAPDAASPAADAAPSPDAAPPAALDPIISNALRLIEEGRETFRFDTFGSEAFWGDTLRLHEAIAGSANGGVGPGISPETALALGLKVDTAALPRELVDALTAGQVDLTDPATTLALLQLDAVVGVKGEFDAGDNLTGVGIRCSLCHSTVDDSFAPGIGERLDGWPNRDLNVGEIIAAAPDLTAFADLLGVDQATVRVVTRSWGPGRFDALLSFDGKAFRPDGGNASTLIPPAYGLAGVNLATYTGWGSVAYWNAAVGALEMHGVGRFKDARLADNIQFPVASGAGFADVTPAPGTDRLTDRLAALQVYQLAIPAPTPPPGSFDAAAAARGKELFAGKGNCASCHVPPLYTEPGHNLHTPAEIGIDSFIADRSPTLQYRTTPLGGVWARTNGGFYHDGRFATLAEVVEHYNGVHSLELESDEVTDLVEFLKSI